MNCQSCNTRIDYLYLTNCSHCGSAIEPMGPLPLPPLPEPPPLESFRKRLTWKKHVANLGYLFLISTSFMVVGAVVVCAVGAITTNVIIDLVDPVETPGEYCALGSLFGFLSIVVGAFLGTMGGTALGVMYPLYRAESH